jgi:hypothetical protein
MPLRIDIHNDMKAALKGGDKERLTTIRMLLAAIKQQEVDERIELSDAQVIAVAGKLVKQRRESADQFRDGHREDLAVKEESELLILQTYLPEPLGEDEVVSLIDEVIKETGAGSIKDMGRVMNEIKSRAQGRVDIAAVSQQVKIRLA